MRFSDHPVCGKANKSMRGIVALLVTGSLAAAAVPLLADAPAAGPAPAPQVAPPAGPPTEAAAAGKEPKFVCDQPSHEFKEVWSGDNVVHTFVIKNTGEAPLEISQVRPSCGCTLTGEYDKLIQPGKEGKIPISVNTKNMSHQIIKTIMVTHNDKTVENPFKLEVKGNVKPRISIEPPGGANFGSVMNETDLTREITVTNNTDKPLKLEKKEGEPESIFSYEMKEVEAGKKYAFTIKANRPFKEGAQNARLAFTTGIEAEPEIYLNCYLFARPLAEVNPQFQAFTVPLKEEWKNENFDIRFNGQGTMKITSVTPSHPQIRTTLTETEPGRVWRMGVIVSAGFDAPETEPVKVVINTDLPDKPQMEVNFRTVRTQQAPLVTAESLIGKPAPVGVVKSTDDTDVRVGAGNDKVTVIDFWASWCGFCKRQLPIVQRIGQTYQPKGVEFVLVSTDNRKPKQEVLKVAQDLAVKLPISFDAKQDLMRAYGVSGFPTLFVIGKNGVVEAVHRGAQAGLEEDLKAQLDALLAGKKPEPRAIVAGAVNPAPSVPPAPAAMANPSLSFDSLRQDTGEHKPDSDVSYKVYYRNDGQQPLNIAAVTGSQGVKINRFDQSLQPGGSGFAEVQFKSPAAPDDISHTLTFDSNDPSRPKQMVELTGAVKPYIEVDPETGVDFGRKVTTHGMPRLATLIYNGKDEIQYLKAESDSPKFEAEVKLIQKGPNAMVIVKTTKDAHFEPGLNEAMVKITTNCKQQPIALVPVQLFLPPPVEVSPAEVELTQQPQLQEKSVTITNNTGSSLHVLGITKSNSKIFTQFFPEPDGLSYKLTLRFMPNFTAPPEGEKITIKTDHPQYGEIVIPIKMANGGHRVSSAQ